MNIINATELYTLKMVIMAKFMSYILPQFKKINNVIQKEFNCMVCELYLNKCVGQKTKPKKKKPFGLCGQADLAINPR